MGSGTGVSGFPPPRMDYVERPPPRVNAEGYPVSPRGTVIRPPPTPPMARPVSDHEARFGATGSVPTGGERPEEPAKCIFELPKLPAPEIATSAVVCGNWVAQVRQVFVGLSPTAASWWSSVEMAAGIQYQKWLTADPIDRLLLDPATVTASFDSFWYQKVESRAVTLILAAVLAYIKDEAVSNRWLSTSAFMFRIQCLYQPGGSSERSMLLSHLVNPGVVKTTYGLGSIHVEKVAAELLQSA